MTREHAELERRLARLERTAARWRIIAVTSFVGILLLAAAPGSDLPTELTVQSLTVKSSAGTGQVRVSPGTIEIERDGAKILLKTDGVAADGRASIEVGSDGHESLLRSGRLALFDASTQLWLEGRADSLQMYQGKKDAAVQLINRESGALLSIGPPDNNTQVRATGVQVRSNGKRVGKFPADR